MTEENTQTTVQESVPVEVVAQAPAQAERSTRPAHGGRGGVQGGRRGPGGRPTGRRRSESDADRPKPEFDQKTISIRRVTRVVSGGRRFAFSAAVAIGNKKGSVGFGVGKAGETALAIQKAYNAARKNLVQLKLSEKNSILHDAKAKYNSARVFLMPNKGRGVVVGSSMRSVIELAGIHDVTGRVISGSKNKINIARATIDALKAFKV